VDLRREGKEGKKIDPAFYSKIKESSTGVKGKK